MAFLTAPGFCGEKNRAHNQAMASGETAKTNAAMA